MSNIDIQSYFEDRRQRLKSKQNTDAAASGGKTAETGAKAIVPALRTQLDHTQNTLAMVQTDLQKAQQTLTDAQAYIAYLEADRAATSQELGRHIGMLQDTWNSTSWRITAPFRLVIRMVRNGIRRLFTKKPPRLTAPITVEAPGRGTSSVVFSPIVQIKRKSAVLTSKEPRRLVIFFFYDGDGIVDPYVPHMLKALRTATSRVFIVVGGSLTAEGKSILQENSDELFLRENKGFDAWCYKAAIQKIGYQELARYDEVILTNHTIMGPVASMDHMFDVMAEKDVDFWGISAHPGLDFDPFDCCPYGKLPAHIQSFFLVFRKALMKSKAFALFWDELPMIHHYSESVGLFEGVLTQYFSDRGYQWDTFIPRGKYDEISDNLLITMPVEMIRDEGCPVFKRRVFFQDLDYIISFTAGQPAVQLIEYLGKRSFNMAMVWKNLLRTCHLSGLAETLHLTRVLPQEDMPGDALPAPAPRIALFMHLYDTDLADEMARYAAAMPDDADFYISTTSHRKKAVIAAAFSHLPNRLDIRVCPNRGRDVSGLLVTFRKIALTYDYICVTHDKRTAHIKPATVGEGFAYQGYENILASKAYVRNIIHTFQREPQLGLLCAPPPNHADFATQIGLEWAGNFPATKRLADRMGLHVPMDEDHYPYAPYGSNFFARADAMAPLLAYPWIYDDFPEEPLRETDGTPLHAVERVYPYVAQHAGYYTAMVMTERYSAVEVGNLQYYAQTYAHLIYGAGIRSRFIGMRDLLDMNLS